MTEANVLVVNCGSSSLRFALLEPESGNVLRRGMAERLHTDGGFDTAFHQTLPRKAHLYAIPYELYERHRIRRYGFHGTSHRYVAGVAASRLGKPLAELELVTAHLGNGCSATAVSGGRSVDT